MTFKQLIILSVIWLMLLATSAIMFGESHPPDQEGRALQIEMIAYVQQFVLKLKMPYEVLQWSALVLPNGDDAAMVYYWPIPERGNAVSTLAVFTFDAQRMLRFSTRHRKAIAAHEVGHIALICQRILPPNYDGMTDHEAIIAWLDYRVLNEGCADIVGAELTSYQDVLEMLKMLFELSEKENHAIVTVLIRRIYVLESVIAKLKENENE